MATRVIRPAHTVPCVFVESYPATEGRSYVQALVRSAGPGLRPLRLIRVLLLTIGAADEFAFGDHVDLLAVEWLTTDINGRRIDWMRAADIRARYLNEEC